jgi:uncharacterized protein YceH (UPF0502 family)
VIPILDERELRVLGALVEKQISTPDYYPLTLNALTNACNQKNHRDPVVSFDESTVIHAIDRLRDKNLAFTFQGSDARVEKFGHSFPKALGLDAAETAVLCVLILRGPQTPGELRSRTAHLHNFESLAEVDATLQKLASRDEPLVVKLPRQPGSRESRFAHLLGGPVDVEAVPAAPSPKQTEAERIAKLEEDVNVLREEVADLKRLFEGFKKQFE